MLLLLLLSKFFLKKKMIIRYNFKKYLSELKLNKSIELIKNYRLELNGLDHVTV